MKLRPTNNNIIVEPEQSSETIRNGIVIPGTVNEKPSKGKVVAVGPGKLKDDGTRMPITGIPGGIDAGSTVLYRKYAGNEIEDESKKYVILADTDIVAVVEEGN